MKIQKAKWLKGIVASLLMVSMCVAGFAVVSVEADAEAQNGNVVYEARTDYASYIGQSAPEYTGEDA